MIVAKIEYKCYLTFTGDNVMKIKFLKSMSAITVASLLTVGVSFAGQLGSGSKSLNTIAASILAQIKQNNPKIDVETIAPQVVNGLKNQISQACGMCKTYYNGKLVNGYNFGSHGHVVCIPCV